MRSMIRSPEIISHLRYGEVADQDGRTRRSGVFRMSKSMARRLLGVSDANANLVQGEERGRGE